MAIAHGKHKSQYGDDGRVCYNYESTVLFTTKNLLALWKVGKVNFDLMKETRPKVWGGHSFRRLWL